MKHFKRTALASVINLALFGIPDAHADTASLERRIHELETRLEKLDQADAPAKRAPVAPAPEVEKLSRKVNSLERKLEVQDEATASTFKSIPVFEAGPEGFKISSANKENLLQIGGSLQTDGRFFINNPSIGSNPAVDRFEQRQARINLKGYFFKDVNYNLLADFANGNLLPDAYLDYTYHPSASLLVGKYRSPISLERLQGDSDTVFAERSFPSSLAPNRDVGIQLHGGFSKPGFKAEKVAGPIDSKNTFTYQVGVTNGSGDNGNNTTASPDTDSNKEVNGRLFTQPFQHTGYHWLEGLGLGVAGSFSSPNRQALSNQNTALGQTRFLDYGLTRAAAGTAPAVGGITANGASYRVYPQAYWYAGPLGLLGEYVVSSQHLTAASGPASTRNVKQDNKAFQIQASYVLTGEDVTFAGVKPIQNFDPLKNKWGALQLAARWSELDVDNSTFLLLDPSKSATKAKAWTVGANWYLNRNAIIRADYENVSFSGGAGTAARVTDRPNEQVFTTRFQLAF
jgi:phosphate-selective porin OprO/OprP